MKRTTLLHAELSRVIAGMGHGDLLVIGDAGLPIPPGPQCIDLAVMRGVPSFADVLTAVLSELQVERAVVAQEACGPGDALPHWCRQLQRVVPTTVPHVQFKQLCLGARAMVRTGEFTPYANVVLYAGVVF
jgi:D-ribose pyranase